MRDDPNNNALSLLLSILNDKKPESPITSVVNANTVGLVCEILSGEDHVDLAARLDCPSDAENLLDLLLHLLRNCLLPNQNDSVDFNRRARRFMFKIVSETPVMPYSLIVTGVSMPAERDYIGGGGYGRVYKGDLHGAVVALKILYRSDNNTQAFCREALMWGTLKHKSVLPLLGIYEFDDGKESQFFLVSPYMANGTLAQWRKEMNPSISEMERHILEVAKGIEYIHSEGVVHGDLRGENVLLDSDLHVQIADFGLTRLSDATNTRSGAKHLNFAAPELFGLSEDSGDDDSDDVPPRTQMSDVYAFGCLYYEIHYDNIPFAGKQELQIMALVFRDKRPPRLDEPSFSDEAWSVIQRCWVREASKRPSMTDIVESISQFASPSTNVRKLQKVSSPPITPIIAVPRREDNILPSLLSLLNNKQPESSVVNATIVDLTFKLLLREDYTPVADQLTQASDVKNLIDFMLHLLHERHLQNQDVNVNIEQRARRFMFTVISKIPVIPQSLIVTGVTSPAAREYFAAGGFGLIFKGELRGSTVALKVLYRSGNSDVALCREALMWNSLKHRFLLPFLGICVDGSTSESFLVSPFMRYGHLREWRDKTNPPMDEIQQRILEVAQGLEYIHSEGVVHGDIHVINILLDANLHVQIASFASARPIEATVAGSGVRHLTSVAPELFEVAKHDDDPAPAGTQMSDVYAFGCLYYEMHYNKEPFFDVPAIQILSLVTRGERPPRLVEPLISDGMWELVQRCWVMQPSKRQRMRDIVEILMI
ncbi:kinase-like domain-containing protein [Amanita rubescens]|nr:kinase-like domain-containing protein [Amanita rubescens]